MAGDFPWHDYDYARQEYTDVAPDIETVIRVQLGLGVTLPAAYVALARVHNGGMPVRDTHASPSPTSWARDHIAINGIFSIGSAKRYSLLGPFGSRFWIEHWGYPALGVYFADCPSAGHDMVALDYRDCGPHGEPTVVHVDQDRDFRVTVLAPSFEAFTTGLYARD